LYAGYIVRIVVCLAFIIVSVVGDAVSAASQDRVADVSQQEASAGRPPSGVAATPPPEASTAQSATGAPRDKKRPLTSSPTDFNITVDGGRGLIRTASPDTLESGQLALGGFVMNFDRNPGDVDFFEYSVQAALGLPGRTEVFVRFAPVVRTNSVGQQPLAYPVPPLDLFVDSYPGDARRSGPYFLFAQEVPYKTYSFPSVRIDPPGHGAFASSSGNVGIGAKVSLLSEDRGARLGVGLRAHVDIPTETPAYNTAEWSEYAGFSGEMNSGLDLLFAKTIRRTKVLANVGYTHVGDPDRGLRIQYVDSSRIGTAGFLVGSPVETGLDLHDQLTVNAGLSLPLLSVKSHRIWLIAELGHLHYVGNGTSTERLVHPWEMRIGVQGNVPGYQNLAVGAAWQLLFNDGGDGDPLSSVLVTPDGRGDVNFGELVDPALSAEVRNFLAGQGATFSNNSSKVLSSDNPMFDRWRNVPTSPSTVVSQGGGNILAFITWRVAKLW
jgi:hypothetical protein